jgi:hypothetical protein
MVERGGTDVGVKLIRIGQTSTFALFSAHGDPKTYPV